MLYIIVHCTKHFFVKLILQCFITVSYCIDGKWLNVSSYFKELVTLISVFDAKKEVVFNIFYFITPTTKGIIMKMVVE